MMKIRRSDERGHAQHGWLDSRHTFSFADYYDPKHMGFRALRVINEDRVQPGRGFGTHGHQNMEIISYVLEGSLEHKDSMGTGSIIRPGDVQRMSAGTGVTHSEFNASQTELVHFLQIWIIPARNGIAPSYEEKTFDSADKQGRLRLVASPEGQDGSVTLHADARMLAGIFAPGEKSEYTLSPQRHAWVQVTRGRLTVNGEDLRAGDGAALSEEGHLLLEGVETAEVIVFDLS